MTNLIRAVRSKLWFFVCLRRLGASYDAGTSPGTSPVSSRVRSTRPHFMYAKKQRRLMARCALSHPTGRIAVKIANSVFLRPRIASVHPESMPLLPQGSEMFELPSRPGATLPTFFLTPRTSPMPVRPVCARFKVINKKRKQKRGLQKVR